MLKLTTAIYEAMRAHGEETYPHECCGVLLGRAAVGVDDVFVNIVDSAVPASNTRTDSPRNRYNIAPQELVRRSSCQARESGLGHRRFLPLASRSPSAVVGHRSCRSALAWLLLRDHQRL